MKVLCFKIFLSYDFKSNLFINIAKFTKIKKNIKKTAWTMPYYSKFFSILIKIIFPLKGTPCRSAIIEKK